MYGLQCMVQQCRLEQFGPVTMGGSGATPSSLCSVCRLELGFCCMRATTACQLQPAYLSPAARPAAVTAAQLGNCLLPCVMALHAA